MSSLAFVPHVSEHSFNSVAVFGSRGKATTFARVSSVVARVGFVQHRIANSRERASAVKRALLHQQGTGNGLDGRVFDQESFMSRQCREG